MTKKNKSLLIILIIGGVTTMIISFLNFKEKEVEEVGVDHYSRNTKNNTFINTEGKVTQGDIVNYDLLIQKLEKGNSSQENNTASRDTKNEIKRNSNNFSDSGSTKGNSIKISDSEIIKGDTIKISDSEIINRQKPLSQRDYLLLLSRARKESELKSSLFSSDTSQESLYTPLSFREGGGTEQVIDSNSTIPLGRMIICRLLQTVNTTNGVTPFIAEIERDFYYNGKLIFLKGTEIHGTIQSSIVNNNRIQVSNNLHFIFNDLENKGKQLMISALALSYSKNRKLNRYEISHGTAGIIGKLKATEEYVKLKSYIATFLSATGQGLIDRISTVGIGGQVVNETTGDGKTALASGATAIANKLLLELEELEKKGHAYVEVPAGTLFYLYTTETIQLNKIFHSAHLITEQKLQNDNIPKKEFSEIEEIKRIQQKIKEIETQK